jgi:hypothetical protein
MDRDALDQNTGNNPQDFSKSARQDSSRHLKDFTGKEAGLVLAYCFKTQASIEFKIGEQENRRTRE